MSEIIDIPTFDKVVTNIDLEDSPPTVLSAAQNVLLRKGKVIKTHGFGQKFNYDEFDDPWDNLVDWDDAKYWVDGHVAKDTDTDIKNIAVFVNEHLSSPRGTGIGYAIIAYIVDEQTNVVTLKYWNGEDWVDVSNMLRNTPDTFYHKYDKNPVVQVDNVMRFLPGNVGTLNSNQAKGIWIGYIKRDLFDQLYTVGTSDEVDLGTKDYKEGFYMYPTCIDKPDISSDGLNVVAYTVASGAGDGQYTTGDIVYFRFSYLYDGTQESLLSDTLRFEAGAGANPFIAIKMDGLNVTTLSKRITGINVYRCDTADGTYQRVHTIDLTRKSTKIKQADDGCFTGLSTVYIPDLSTYDFDSGVTYQLLINALAKEDIATTLDGTGYDVFTGVNGVSAPWNGTDLWGTDHTWELYNKGTGIKVANGTGVWGGSNAIIVNEDLGVSGKYAGGVILNSTVGATLGDAQLIDDNYGKAVHTNGAIGTIDDEDWYVMSPLDGLYCASISGNAVTYKFFENDLTEIAEHPYPNATSLNINGQHASIIHGILALGDIVLDPGIEDEEHQDWIGYSELDAYDVLKVSNVKPVPDREGGRITGLGSSFGSWVITKKHFLGKMTIADPEDDSTWEYSESKLERGNYSPQGMVQVGHNIYMPSYDGIYRVDLNLLASADETPLIHNRITEDINDIYLALHDVTQKPFVKGIHDQANTEIIWQFDNDIIWAYNYVEEYWRKIVSDIDIDLASLDQEGNPIILNDLNSRLYCTFEKESVISSIKTKRFRLSAERGEPIRSLRIIHETSVALTVNVYTDGEETTPINTFTLPSSAGVLSVSSVGLRTRGKYFILEIIDSSANQTDWEIGRLRIEVN